MKLNKNLMKILFTIEFIVLFLSFTQVVYALSLGISPSEKVVELRVGQTTNIYFAISQSSEQNESITVSTDVNWLTIDPEKFELEPMGQKYIKLTIKELPVGNYTAKVKASASAPGIVGMIYSVTAKLTVAVLPMVQPQAEAERINADMAIAKARETILESRKIGGNTTIAETVLTNALEEFDKGNYEVAKNLANIAYLLALESYGKAERGLKLVLNPILFAILVIAIGASIVIIFIVYEILRIHERKGLAEELKAIKGLNCSKCGASMVKTYDGVFLISHVCPRCGHQQVKERYGLK